MGWIWSVHANHEPIQRYPLESQRVISRPFSHPGPGSPSGSLLLNCPGQVPTVGTMKNTTRRTELKKQIRAVADMIENDGPLLGVHQKAWTESWTKQLLEMVRELETIS